MAIKTYSEKTFEEVLAELDAMIEADFTKFKQDLNQLSIRESMDKVFENPDNNINLAGETLHLIGHNINIKDESTGDTNYDENHIIEGENNS